MNCKKCGATLTEGARFCGECGSIVEDTPEQKEYIYCNSCGAKIEAGSSFCGECGKAVIPVSPSSDETEYLSPERTPSNIAHATLPNSAPKNNNTILLVIILVLILVLAGGAIWFMVSRYSSPKVNVDINPIATAGPENSSDSTDYSWKKSEGDLSNKARPTVLPAPTSQPGVIGNTGDYLFNSDTQYITDAYLDTQSQSQVRLILNEMYARHGYIFTTKEYKDYFSKKSWYTPKYTSDSEAEAHFNSIEKENKNKIVKYEQSKGWR